jgi:hypothetical protein
MTMSIRDEIDDARRQLRLSTEQLAEVEDGRARELTTAFLARFTGGEDVRWWWEYFPMPAAAVHFDDGKGFTRITAIVPDPDERIWFVTEDDQLPYFPVYETTPAIAQQVIGQCYGFEYYLIAKDLGWLLCENHHDTLFATGAVHDRLLAQRPR